MRRKDVERKKSKQFIMPMGYGSREPNGLSPLAEFIMSCEDEVSPEEALRDYQENWCSHPRRGYSLISIIAQPFAERFEYEVQCGECGISKTLKGRPPSWLTKKL